MFFMMGISNGEKKLDFTQTIICSICGAYGRYEVIMSYMYLSLFFIPVFRWNKHFYVRTTCCNTVYELNPELGKKIARGEKIEIQESDLQMVSGRGRRIRRCSRCGFTTEENFSYCPHCSNPME